MLFERKVLSGRSEARQESLGVRIAPTPHIERFINPSDVESHRRMVMVMHRRTVPVSLRVLEVTDRPDVRQPNAEL